MSDDILTEGEQTRRNRRNLILLFALGIVPLVTSYVVYFYFPAMMPESTTNQGHLLMPPVNAEELGIANADRKWLLAIPLEANCDDQCESRFYLARQINVALGKESTRVVRLLVSTANADPDQLRRIVEAYPDMDVASIDGGNWIRTLIPVVDDPLRGNYVYLVDPHGNMMMVYSLEKLGKPMLKDLKHLLKISNIG